MRNILLYICLLLLTIPLMGQKFETNLLISPKITFGCSNTDQSNIGWGLSIAVQEFYNINQKYSFGIGVNYSIGKMVLYRELGSAGIPENMLSHRSYLELAELGMPVLLRYLGPKKWRWEFGYGLSYLTKSDVLINSIVTDATGNKIESRLIYMADELAQDFNNYLIFGFEKLIMLEMFKIILGIKYTANFSAYTFIYNMDFYEVTPHYISIEVGICL